MTVLDFESAHRREEFRPVFRYAAERTMRPSWFTWGLWLTGAIAGVWLIATKLV